MAEMMMKEENCHLLTTSLLTRGRGKKKQSEAKTKNQTVYLGDGVFSVQYWQYHRCFVRVKSDIFDTGGDTNFCTKSSCTENRRLAIRNNTDFQCTHIQKVADDIEAGLVNST